MSDARGFPWDIGEPTRPKRLAFSITVGLIAGAMHYFKPAGNGGLSDFSGLWYGSTELLRGHNPYDLIGPHLIIDFPSYLYYPAPALVAVGPFTLLPVDLAGTVFVFLSALLLAFGMTADGWYRIPMLASVSFFTSARLGQWSILMTAAVFLPAVAFLSVAKPQASLPVLAGTSSRKTWIFASIGAVILTTISFAKFPGWMNAWLERLQTADYFQSPILTLGGSFIALVLLRWRRPEAWLIFASACIPQTWYAYNALLLFVVASTYREACFLSLTSSVGWLAVLMLGNTDWRSSETVVMFRWVLIVFCYFPAVILVLRRANTGQGPAWMSSVSKRPRAQRAA